MLIGIISDSHDRLPTLQAALAQFAADGVQAVFHAGDFVAPFAAKWLAPDRLSVPLHAIYGNNDGERAGLKKILPQLVDGPLRMTLAGRVIVMHHFFDWFAAGDLVGADVVISGHDHQARIESVDGQLRINPGECCGWVTGRCSVAELDLQTMQARLIDLPA